MIKSIEDKVAYSNDLLHICFYYEINNKKRSPLNTLIYKTIKYVVINILTDINNKKDWYWLREYVLKSTIWFFKIEPMMKSSKYLWYEFFTWIDEEFTAQRKELSKSMHLLQNNSISRWNKLIQYDINTKYSNIEKAIRQDMIYGGLKPEYSKQQLMKTMSLTANTSFNPVNHYDLSQYLTKLILISHECDDRFQADIQEIFEINTDTKQNKLLKLTYLRCPVKSLQECYIQCQSLYKMDKFPTSSRLIDVVSCSLIFEDVSCML